MLEQMKQRINIEIRTVYTLYLYTEKKYTRLN